MPKRVSKIENLSNDFEGDAEGERGDNKDLFACRKEHKNEETNNGKDDHQRKEVFSRRPNRFKIEVNYFTETDHYRLKEVQGTVSMG